MTPLLGTKTPSAPLGAKSGGERRAARSLLSCALWRGMGRLWRGMGGMGRPEPLSAHRPRRQQGLSGFHETRDPRPETRLLPSARRKPARIPRFSRNTRHETRLFFESRPFCQVGRPLMREGGRPAGFKGGCTKRCVNEWKEVYLNPETKITTFSESRLGSRPGISHNIPLCIGKIRISPCRPSSAPEHCGNRDIGFMDVSRPSLTFAGPQVSPSGEVKGERATNRETKPLIRRAAQAGPSSEVFTKHETRNTNHGFYSNHGFFSVGAPGWRHRKPPSGPLRPPASHCFPVHRCSPLFTIVRHCSRKNIVWSQCPAPPGHCLPAQNCPAWRGFERLSRGLRGGEWGVSRRPCPVRRSQSALRRASPAGQLPLPRTQNEPMLRKENVPACISHQVKRRSECGLRITAFKAFTIHYPLPFRFSRITRHESRITAFLLPASTVGWRDMQARRTRRFSGYGTARH